MKGVKVTDFAQRPQAPGASDMTDTAAGTDLPATAQELAHRGMGFLPTWLLVAIVVAVVIMAIVLARRRRR